MKQHYDVTKRVTVIHQILTKSDLILTEIHVILTETDVSNGLRIADYITQFLFNLFCNRVLFTSEEAYVEYCSNSAVTYQQFLDRNHCNIY